MSGTSPEEKTITLTPAQKLNEALQQAAAAVSDLGEEFSVAQDDLAAVQKRLEDGRFNLAVLGQFKRGKSTLLNALLGDDLLPTDILPVTAIPTFIHFGSEVGGAVHFIDRPDPVTYAATGESSLATFLNDYVTEAGNPHNRRQVSRVEISHPAPLLQQGVVLIDTPGVGSTLKHNTELAYQILAQCDAALFLLSPDPPITETELDYLQTIKERLPRTFYLLNKVDFLDDQQQVASLQFLAQQLSPLYDSAPQVMPISARKGLQARLSGDAKGWEESGMQVVEQDLIDLFAREKQQALHLSLERRSQDLFTDLDTQLRISLKVLKMPADELQQLLEQLRQSLAALEREKQAAVDLLAGDLKRVINRLGEEVGHMRGQAKEQILAQVEAQLDAIEDPEEMERQVHDTIAAEMEPFFVPALHAVANVIRREVTELLGINQRRSNTLIEQVRQRAAELLDIPCAAPAAERACVAFEVPVWSSDLFVSDKDPLGQMLSRKLFSKKYRRRRTVKRLRAESQVLLNQNVAQISWALRQSLEKSFREFGAELREQLDMTIAGTRTAMELALKRGESHYQETAKREVCLQKAIRTLDKIRQELADG
jgi:GTP-binding protein EngB required for normal cell division